MDDHLHKQPALTKSVISVLLGLISLVLGGRMIVDSAVFLAQKIGMSNTFVGLTIVALGTSLPELVTSAVAAWKKNPEIAVGNVVGSNIFNITLILGISAILKPLPLKQDVNIDISVAVLSSLMLFLFMFTWGKKILDRWEGALFIIVYVVYIAYIIARG